MSPFRLQVGKSAIAHWLLGFSRSRHHWFENWTKIRPRESLIMIQYKSSGGSRCTCVSWTLRDTDDRRYSRCTQTIAGIVGQNVEVLQNSYCPSEQASEVAKAMCEVVGGGVSCRSGPEVLSHDSNWFSLAPSLWRPKLRVVKQKTVTFCSCCK